MTKMNFQPIIEALLFAAGDEGLSIEQIATVLEISKHDAKKEIQEMEKRYDSSETGLQIVALAGGYQFVTKKEMAPYLQKLVRVPTIHALTQAALETLAIIAYKQPITRMEIEEVRGVKVEGPLQKLLMRVLIKEVGRAEQVGRPILYGTTNEFLDYFGLKSLDELPDLTALYEGELSSDEELDLFNFGLHELNQETELKTDGDS